MKRKIRSIAAALGLVIGSSVAGITMAGASPASGGDIGNLNHDITVAQGAGTDSNAEAAENDGAAEQNDDGNVEQVDESDNQSGDQAETPDAQADADGGAETNDEAHAGTTETP